MSHSFEICEANFEVCGDVANIDVASAPGLASTNPNNPQFYTRSAVPQLVDESLCNAPCSGDGQYLCGSGNLMAYYAWDGPAPLSTWDFPTGTDMGEYSLLIGGVVVPLIVGQGINGKVQFTEKVGTGEPNGTGAYELDLSQIDNFDMAWREMTGMDTDVFCSAGLTLPDKAGRVVTVGGWAGESNFGIRLYTPDGSEGVPGTNRKYDRFSSHSMLTLYRMARRQRRPLPPGSQMVPISNDHGKRVNDGHRR